MNRKLFVILLSVVMVIAGMPGMASGANIGKTEDRLQVFSDMPNNWSKEALENAAANVRL